LQDAGEKGKRRALQLNVVFVGWGVAGTSSDVFGFTLFEKDGS
jgi:hypothetical protein